MGSVPIWAQRDDSRVWQEGTGFIHTTQNGTQFRTRIAYFWILAFSTFGSWLTLGKCNHRKQNWVRGKMACLKNEFQKNQAPGAKIPPLPLMVLIIAFPSGS